jgi:hypothetical protein
VPSPASIFYLGHVTLVSRLLGPNSLDSQLSPNMEKLLETSTQSLGFTFVLGKQTWGKTSAEVELKAILELAEVKKSQTCQ